MDRIFTRIFTVSAVAVILIGGGSLTALADDPVTGLTGDVQAATSEIAPTVDSMIEPVDEVATEVDDSVDTSEVVTKVDESVDKISGAESAAVQSTVETDHEVASPSAQSPATDAGSGAGQTQPAGTGSESVGAADSGSIDDGNGTVVQRREPKRGKKSKKEALDQLVSIGDSIKASAGALNAAEATVETEVLDTAIIEAEESSTLDTIARLALTGIDPIGHLVIALCLIGMGIRLTRSRPRRKGPVVVIEDERARLLGARLAAI